MRGEYISYASARHLIQTDNREDGISGFYRVKNEEELLTASLDSHIPHLDEIIIVYNNCSDKTPQIAHEYEKKYPDKVKVYEYKPKVYPALSFEHVITPASSPHSLVNYYNYALSKTTKKIVLKIDADHIVVPEQFEQAVGCIQRSGIKTMHYFFGVNIFTCKNGFCVNTRQPFTYGFDCGFFPITNGVYFVHRKDCESLHLPFYMYLTRKSLGVLFYHLKGVKLDRGTNSLKDLTSQKASAVKDNLYYPKLMSWNEYAKDNRDKLQRVTDPNSVIFL